eukprot:m.380224 g.380224  ORF g.380224 m.380224 type:complete len:56 (+) comp20957_c2_seq71:1764-1931(+)
MSRILSKIPMAEVYFSAALRRKEVYNHDSILLTIYDRCITIDTSLQTPCDLQVDW